MLAYLAKYLDESTSDIAYQLGQLLLLVNYFKNHRSIANHRAVRVRVTNHKRVVSKSSLACVLPHGLTSAGVGSGPSPVDCEAEVHGCL